MTGPPCSGKSTFVREGVARGDVVVDYDTLAVALGSPDSHDHPEALRPVVLAAWLAAIAAAVARPGRVWLIRVNPTARDREMASRVVELDTSAAVCKARALESGRPAGWSSLIDEWFSSRPS